ncbi:flagellar biosynthetic protein FliP [Paucimonas lemoignei]|uniref:Flagellar biosynthetic protein FliP n=1 Tax=Paucimonas lemoignei TaxID=29443 RepID=A0A4R3HX40_PAULE|nr:flagellar type III secretion system pore protein FliP [Paucimonas lemoignei]TCS37732.1 flagellar biosynthetic protein FliP [Paucimonas lemoignei]
MRFFKLALLPLAFLLLLALAGHATAADASIGGFDISITDSAKGKPQDLGMPIKLLILLSLLSLAPAILFTMTAFTRIIIILSMIRHAIGMPETPPNQVLVSLALFLTLFTMMPVLEQINKQAYQPYTSGQLKQEKALEIATAQVKEFMIRQTREQDLMLMVELSQTPAPQKIEDISMTQLIPAYMLSELKTAFQIGFVIFLPFLLIDLVVSSVLMSLGMMMVPPVVISLPLKVLMFVLIDGWNLVVRAMIGSFH